MRPEKHVGTHPVMDGLATQKSAKLSGLTDNLEDADAGGFLALLASQCLDSQPVAEAVETDGPDTLGKSSLTASATDLGAGEPLTAPSDAASAAGNASRIDLAFLLLQSGSLLPTDQLETSRMQLPPAISGSSVMELTSNVGGSQGLPSDPAKKASGGTGSIASAHVELKPVELYRPKTDISAASFAGVSTGLASASVADLIGDKAGTTEKKSGKSVAEKTGAPADTGAQSKAQDLRILKLLSTADSFVARGLAVDPIVVRSIAENDLRQIERQLTKTQSGAASVSVEGIFGSQVQFSGERPGLSPAASAVDVAQPEVYVAEQVSYWVSRDVQNAELKLKGFDDFPIDVHISLQGNDAQVDFRTDHAEIRDILRTAEGHLKDMLAREGLVLSGVSVGTSRRDDQDQSGQHQPFFSRQQAVVAEDQMTPSGVSRPLSRSGGAIDVFV